MLTLMRVRSAVAALGPTLDALKRVQRFSSNLKSATITLVPELVLSGPPPGRRRGLGRRRRRSISGTVVATAGSLLGVFFLVLFSAVSLAAATSVAPSIVPREVRVCHATEPALEDVIGTFAKSWNMRKLTDEVYVGRQSFDAGPGKPKRYPALEVMKASNATNALRIKNFYVDDDRLPLKKESFSAMDPMTEDLVSAQLMSSLLLAFPCPTVGPKGTAH